jgi:ADP-heptose:LPS heptosyltransferase
VETIIIFRIGSLGDTVVALPCFHRIARSFSKSRRILVTNVAASRKAAPAESVLTNSGLIDGVIYLPTAPRRLRGSLRLRKAIRKTKAKTLIYVADRDVLRTLRDLCFFRLCGIEHVIGAPISRDLRRPRVDPAGHVESEAERLARCLAPLGRIDLDNPGSWDLNLQPQEIRSADRSVALVRERGFLAINIGGKAASKDWGDDNWATLLERIAARHAHLALAFFGSTDEFDRCSRLAACWPGTHVNLCGRLAPRESAAAMRRALLFIGHDSGPLHLAAAAGVPCVGIFGNLNKPKWWHPIGRQHRIIHDMRGIRHIRPEEVYADVCSTISAVSGQTTTRTAGMRFAVADYR